MKRTMRTAYRSIHAYVTKVGDTICITPGTPHCIANMGDAPLRILCACSPAYSHEDTELL